MTLFSSVKETGATLVSIVRTRLALLGNEVEEEKNRALKLLIWVQAMAFCTGMAVLLFVAILLAAFWEYRLWVLIASCALFLGLIGVCGLFFRKALVRSAPVFAVSVAELEEDIRQLKAAVDQSGHGTE